MIKLSHNLCEDNTDTAITHVKCGHLIESLHRRLIFSNVNIEPLSTPIFVIDYMLPNDRAQHWQNIHYFATDGTKYCRLFGYLNDEYLPIMGGAIRMPSRIEVHEAITKYLASIKV